MRRDIYTRLVYGRNSSLLGRLSYYLLKLSGVEIPISVKVGKELELAHGGFGVVIHSSTIIGDKVKIYPGVVIGRADIYRPMELSEFKGVIVEDGAILCPGAKVLCKEGILTVGKNSVVGANAVLLQSTGYGEIWGGVPARFIKRRDETS